MYIYVYIYVYIYIYIYTYIYIYNDLKVLERGPLRYCKCDGKVPFLVLSKVTFDEHVNALEKY